LILAEIRFLSVIPDKKGHFPLFLWGYTDCVVVLNNYLITGDKMSQHDTLLAAFETYKAENEKFIEKGIKASAARARKALQEIAGACKERRKEITATKEAMEAKK
jgi:hypothetical protein